MGNITRSTSANGGNAVTDDALKVNKAFFIPSGSEPTLNDFTSQPGMLFSGFTTASNGRLYHFNGTSWDAIAKLSEAGGGSGAQSDWNETDPDAPSYIQNKPTIPTNTNQLTNGAGFITASSSDNLTNKTGNISQWTNNSGYALLASPTFTGTVSLPSTTSIGTVSETEISYVDGVTSSIQTQLDSKDSVLTFNSPLSRSINTVSMPSSTNSVDGYLSSANWRNFVNSASTGVISFGGLAIASSTTFNVGAVKGWIIDNETDPALPAVPQYVNYAGISGVTATYVASATTTYILLTPSLTILQQTTHPTPLQRRQNIFLGQLGHANLTSIIQVFNSPDITLEPASQLRDILKPIHLINSGVSCSPNGVNLSFNTSAGSLYGLGIGMVADVTKPNELAISSQTPTTFQYRTQTGGTESNVTVIDPASYDVSGTVTAIGGGVNQATNQRIYLTQTGIVRVQYGQTIYSSLTNAVTAAQTETFVTFSNFMDNAILIGILSVRKGATDLSNSDDAVLHLVSKFGESTGGTSGISTTTLQQGYNNSTTPEILTDATRGAVSIKRGSGADTDNVLEILNGADAVTVAITGAGTIGSATWGGSVIGSTFGGAGTVNGLLKANGSGTVSAATSGTDYEPALTFSTGLTRATNTITSNLSVGVSGGQSVIGGTASGNNLTLSSTSNATKGKVLFGTSAYDEVNSRLGIGTNAPTDILHLSRAGEPKMSLENTTQGIKSSMSLFGANNLARFLFRPETTDKPIGFYVTANGSGNVSGITSFFDLFKGDYVADPANLSYMQIQNGVGLAGINMKTAGSGVMEDFNIFGNDTKFVTVLSANGRVGIGQTTPTAALHLKAGTATANTAPFKYTSGTNLSAVEDGAKEFNGTNEFLSAGGVRYTLAKTLTNTATLNFDLTAVNYQDLTITVTGAADGDSVVVGAPNGAVVADITYFGWVSAANTVTIRASRVGGGGAADPASGTFRAAVIKY